MTKKFFVHVSPKAAEGIRRVYTKAGAEVHAKVGADGNATVVVISNEGSFSSRSGSMKQKKPAKQLLSA